MGLSDFLEYIAQPIMYSRLRYGIKLLKRSFRYSKTSPGHWQRCLAIHPHPNHQSRHKSGTLALCCFCGNSDALISHHGFTFRLGLVCHPCPFQIFPRGKHPGRRLLLLAGLKRDRRDSSRLHYQLPGTHKHNA